MSKLFNKKTFAAGKELFNTIKNKLNKKSSGLQSPVISSVKTNVPKTYRQKSDADHKINMAKIPGRGNSAFRKVADVQDKTLTKYRKFNQKVFGEKETKSGISKGKDSAPDRKPYKK